MFYYKYNDPMGIHVLEVILASEVSIPQPFSLKYLSTSGYPPSGRVVLVLD
jgi:hypothetical protein